MKKINFVLSAAATICLVATSCVKEATDGPKGQVPGNPLNNFNWKTTKTVPVNIVSENGEVVPVSIYDGTELVAAGYTPFNENISISKSGTELKAVAGRLPISYFLNEGRSASRANNDDVVTFQAGNSNQIKIKAPDKNHKHLYDDWAQSKRGGFSYAWFVNDWWQTMSSEQRFGITLYADREEPQYDDKGNLVYLYHTCETEGCPGYISGDDNAEDNKYVIFPAKGTYIFEDLFPSFGDYDMNDFVVVESKNTSVWPNNKVRTVQLKYTVTAAGSSKAIAMAVRLLGVKQHDVETITMQKLDENGVAVPFECTNSTNLFTLADNKIEVSSINDEVVIPIFENFFDLTPPSAKGFGFNTNKTIGGKGEPITIIVTIDFDKESRNIKYSEFGTDVFIMTRSTTESDVTLQRGNEIHVADAGYTSKMNTTLFKTYDDASESETKCFRATNGYPWGMYLFSAETFDHSLESVKIYDAYPKFNDWIKNAGTDNAWQYENWFKTGNAINGKTWGTSQE